MRAGAQHHNVAKPRHHAGRVFDCFAASQLCVRLIEEHGLAAKLTHGKIKRKPCAG